MRYAATAAVLGLALSGCGSGTEPSIAPDATGGPVPPAATASGIPPELRVDTARDLRGVAPCDLLTDEQLTDLGLAAGTGEPGGTPSSPGCTWQYAADRQNIAAVGYRVDTEVPALAGLYRIRDVYETFEPLRVAGHPAVRADRNAGEGCSLAVAAADDQLLDVVGNIAERPVPEPCALPRRMAELILSNLPPTS